MSSKLAFAAPQPEARIGVGLASVGLERLIDACRPSEEVDVNEVVATVVRPGIEFALKEVLDTAAVRVRRAAHDDERRQIDKG